MTSLVLKVVIVVAFLRQDVEGAAACVCTGTSPWGSWNNMGDCVGCQKVYQRMRVCWDPFSMANACPEYDIADCPPPDAALRCPVNGAWGAWITGECSVSCGDGRTTITRACDNPAPMFRGNSCVGINTRLGDACIATIGCPEPPSNEGWSSVIIQWAAIGMAIAIVLAIIACIVGRMSKGSKNPPVEEAAYPPSGQPSPSLSKTKSERGSIHSNWQQGTST